MEFTLALKALWARRRLVIPGVVVCALLTAVIAFRGLPLHPATRQVEVWQASAQILVDADPSVVGDLGQGLDPLIPRAGVYANLMASPALAALIAQAAHLPPATVSIVGPIGSNGQRPVYRPSGAGGAGAYTLQLDADPAQPIIRALAQGPTARGALALANGASAGLAAYVLRAQAGAAVPERHRVAVHQLGPATESPTESGIAPALALPIFLALSVVWCMLILFAMRFRVTWELAGGSQAPALVAPEPWPDGYGHDPALDAEADRGAEAGGDPEVADRPPVMAPGPPRSS